MVHKDFNILESLGHHLFVATLATSDSIRARLIAQLNSVPGKISFNAIVGGWSKVVFDGFEVGHVGRQTGILVILMTHMVAKDVYGVHEMIPKGLRSALPHTSGGHGGGVFVGTKKGEGPTRLTHPIIIPAAVAPGVAGVIFFDARAVDSSPCARQVCCLSTSHINKLVATIGNKEVVFGVIGETPRFRALYRRHRKRPAHAYEGGSVA